MQDANATPTGRTHMVKSRNCQGPQGNSSKPSGKSSTLAYLESWLLELQLVIQCFPLPEGRESPKAWGTVYLSSRNRTQPVTRSGMQAISRPERPSWLWKPQVHSQRINGTGEVPGSSGTLTWWWNSTSSSSWTPQNSHGMTTLSSTGGELLKPIKDSKWSLADCRISFWKITSGSSTPRGEVLPTLSGGKAHEGLQLVCLKKHRLKQNKKKKKKKTQKLRNKLNSENIFRKSQHFHNA